MGSERPLRRAICNVASSDVTGGAETTKVWLAGFCRADCSSFPRARAERLVIARSSSIRELTSLCVELTFNHKGVTAAITVTSPAAAAAITLTQSSAVTVHRANSQSTTTVHPTWTHTSTLVGKSWGKK